jgi:hypothetical protein
VEASGVSAKYPPDLVPHPAEDRENLFLGTKGLGRIIEAPVISPHLPRKDRADLVGAAANGDHGVDRAVQELVQVLRPVARGIEADLGEHPHCEGMDVAGGTRAGAMDLHQVASGSA